MQEQESTQHTATPVKPLEQHKFFSVLGLLGHPKHKHIHYRVKNLLRKQWVTRAEYSYPTLYTALE